MVAFPRRLPFFYVLNNRFTRTYQSHKAMRIIYIITCFCMLFCFAACNQRKNNTNTIKSIPDINSYKNDSIVYSNQLLYQDSLKLQEPIGNKITVYRSNQELQSIICNYDWSEYGKPMDVKSIGKTTYEDVNFDNKKDLVVYLGAFGNQGVQYYQCYLWNDKNQKFLISPSFQQIANPTINNDTRCIYSFSRTSANEYEHIKYEFRNGIFVQTASLVERKEKNGFSYIEKRENDKTVVKTSSLKDIDKEWKQYIIMYK